MMPGLNGSGYDEPGSLAAILSGGNPLVNIGLGLLAAGGPQRFPMSVGQRLAQGFQTGNAMGQGFMENRIARAKLRGLADKSAAEARRAAAIGRLEKLDPALGLLAEIDPSAAGTALGRILSPDRERTGGLQRDYEFLKSIGVPDEQAKGLAMQKFRGGSDLAAQLIDLMKMQQAEKGQLETQKLRREETEAVKTQTETEKLQRSALSNTLNQLREAAALNDKLDEGGLLAKPGLGGEEVRRFAAGLLGAGSKAYEQTAADLDRFEKLTSEQVIKGMGDLKNTGVITDAKLSLMTSVKPSFAAGAGANRKLLADMMEQVLQQADAKQIPVEDRGGIEAEIKRLRGQGTRPSGPSPREERLPANLSRERLRQNLDTLQVIVKDGKAFLRNKNTERERELTREERRELGIRPEMLR